MLKRGGFYVVTALCLIVAGGWAYSQGERERDRQRRPVDGQRGAVGRYQMFELRAGNTVLLLDTATGRIWNRTHDGEWLYEGNPTRDRGRGFGGVRRTDEAARARSRRSYREFGDRARRERGHPEPWLILPSGSVEMTIHQREVRPIPGSQGTVQMRISDITEGQMLISVRTRDETLLDRERVSTGDEVEFQLNGREYEIRVDEMKNLLTGNDYARLVISDDGDADEEEDEGEDDAEDDSGEEEHEADAAEQ